MLTQKKHVISLLSYLGIGFISGAISHGFFSGTRSLVMACLGIILFLIGEYLKWEHGSYVELFVFALIYSVAVGMFSGGFQHFLDSPMRSLRIIPLGYFISLLVYPYKEWLRGYNLRWSLIRWLVISLCLYALIWLMIWIVPAKYFMQPHHDTPADLYDQDTTLEESAPWLPAVFWVSQWDSDRSDHVDGHTNH
jgi:hypothetical protein